MTSQQTFKIRVIASKKLSFLTKVCCSGPFFPHRLCVTVCFRLRSSWTVPSTWWGVCLPSRSRRTSVTSSTWWVAVDVLLYLSALSNKVTATLGHWLFTATLGERQGVELSWLAVTALTPPNFFNVHFMSSLLQGWMKSPACWGSGATFLWWPLAACRAMTFSALWFCLYF